MNLTFEIDEKFLQRATPIAMAVLLVTIVVAYFVFRGPDYSQGEQLLAELKATGRAPSSEELVILAPLLAHPDIKMSQSANQYFTVATPAVITAAASQRGNLNDDARERFDGHWVRADPSAAVRELMPMLSSDSRAVRHDAAMKIVSTPTPEAVAAVEMCLNDKDETIVRDICSQLEARPDLAARAGGLRGKLDELANDTAQPEGVRFHAKRALARVMGQNTNTESLMYPRLDPKTAKPQTLSKTAAQSP